MKFVFQIDFIGKVFSLFCTVFYTLFGNHWFIVLQVADVSEIHCWVTAGFIFPISVMYWRSASSDPLRVCFSSCLWVTFNVMCISGLPFMKIPEHWVPAMSDSLSALRQLALMLELGPLSISPLIDIELVRRGSERTLHKEGFLFLATAAWPCVAQMQGQPVALCPCGCLAWTASRWAHRPSPGFGTPSPCPDTDVAQPHCSPQPLLAPQAVSLGLSGQVPLASRLTAPCVGLPPSRLGQGAQAARLLYHPVGHSRIFSARVQALALGKGCCLACLFASGSVSALECFLERSLPVCLCSSLLWSLFMWNFPCSNAQFFGLTLVQWATVR